MSISKDIERLSEDLAKQRNSLERRMDEDTQSSKETERLLEKIRALKERFDRTSGQPSDQPSDQKKS